MEADCPRLSVESFLQEPGPIIDVRSPGEFGQGHIPGARNLALFSDEERALVGTAYKQQGRAAAVGLGLELVGPKLAELGRALAGHQSDPDQSQEALRIHCWRGGMRSASIAWLAGVGDQPCLLLEGGYKAYRQWVLASLEQPRRLLLLSGRTGTGKTDLLLALRDQGQQVLDLEGLANHRGSSFGGLGQAPQPSNEHFENELASVLDGCRDDSWIWVEAESAQVGRCRIPTPIWRQMQQAPTIEIQRPMVERLERLVAVYGPHDRGELAEATERISRRLGPQRTAIALGAIATGNLQEACGQMLDYYDRCYDHELARRQQPALASLDLAGLDDQEASKQLLARALVATSHL
ncbi:tRNA 2-selenouridine(34) synthase MnmH [Cyanobium sp. HWJ4-Hawea]|uniref:tRNA 2-selenouridine(34) synthase MnmH n=1 Tax=Cyanobium sp. HWJ4-Hawea TaxID=2823713 RepID=UPI0020CD5852|nr:tRNA 2-selenouridine(34) synthase MnmH [Cyanobium sp. HWJ4-Hawea]MCP9808886.1 tRNA 2-selenouridine(34) synthase MnmH [Cyanobium sp. HWJ4-Hawea]